MMSENPNVENDIPGGQTPSGSQSQPAGDASWQDVGKQFEVLGQSLAQTVRAAWENEATQRQVQEMRAGLESLVREVEKAIQDSTHTPKGQQIRQDAERAAESLKTASQQTVQEVRPHLVSALQQVNEELQRLINRMQPKE